MRGHRSELPERTWIALLIAFFLFGLATSWQRWGNPVIDTGREMNQPLRLLAGERLYSDIGHIYGPLSPWFHAALFDWFGPSLSVLYADGIVTAVMVLLLIYWLSRRLLDPAAATATTLAVMFLCAFKPAGNYFLPYSYNALHATLFGLLTVAVLIDAAVRDSGRGSQRRRARTVSFAAAGLLAGVTVLAKTEMGAAAVVAGLAAAVLVRTGRRDAAVCGLVFLIAAACVVVPVYGAIAARIGWTRLAGDNWLLFYDVPRPLAEYNQRVSGFDAPLRSLVRMGIAAVKVGILAAVIGACAVLAARRSTRDARGVAGEPPQGGLSLWRHPRRVLGAAVIAALFLSLTTGFDWDKGPYLAMPLLLGAFIVWMAARPADVFVVPGARSTTHARETMLILAAYALASLARMILHVRSGGAYGSYLLPASVVMFTYLWVGPFAGSLGGGRATRIARTVAVVLIMGDAIATGGLLAYRYQTRIAGRISAERGTMYAPPDVALAWNQAMRFIDTKTRPGDPVAVLPEGTSLVFLSGRTNPLREEIATPGFVEGRAERRAIARLRDTRTPLVLIANRPTAEFGAPVFGRDYSRGLMAWIASNYHLCAVFGPVSDPDLEIGASTFFVKGYCRDEP